MSEKSLHERSRDYWDSRAEEFSSLWMGRLHQDIYDSLKAYIQMCLPQKPEIEVLELGCGAGFLTILLAELGVRVTAIDFSEDMLEQAKKNLEEQGLSKQVTFYKMDVQNLSFPDEHFDFVLNRNLIWILTEPQRAYQEMVRVLRPGGRLLTFDANYGKQFRQARERGEEPTHPTQTKEQLNIRDEITLALDSSSYDRPEWDLVTLWQTGLSRITCDRDYLQAVSPQVKSSGAGRENTMFAIYGEK